MSPSDLADIEQIRQLKARYFRFLDTKQWDAWRGLFTDDFTAHVQGPHPDLHYATPEQLVQENRELLADVPTVHHGHTSEISITGSDSATGIWAMYDRVELPGNFFEGYGHYHEEYRREPGGWKIRRMRITRLKIAPLAS